MILPVINWSESYLNLKKVWVSNYINQSKGDLSSREKKKRNSASDFNFRVQQFYSIYKNFHRSCPINHRWMPIHPKETYANIFFISHAIYTVHDGSRRIMRFRAMVNDHQFSEARTNGKLRQSSIKKTLLSLSMTPLCHGVAPATFSPPWKAIKILPSSSQVFQHEITAKNFVRFKSRHFHKSYRNPNKGGRIFYETCCYERYVMYSYFSLRFPFFLCFNRSDPRENSCKHQRSNRCTDIFRHIFSSLSPSLLRKSGELSVLAAEVIFCLG